MPLIYHCKISGLPSYALAEKDSCSESNSSRNPYSSKFPNQYNYILFGTHSNLNEKKALRQGQPVTGFENLHGKTIQLLSEYTH